MLDILKAHSLLKERKASSKELTSECIKNAKESGANTFISLLEDGAIYQAEKIDLEIQKSGIKGYLHGIPYTLKDLFITKDIRTTAGSKILYNYVPPFDGHISESLKNAGGILVGKVGCDEFGMGSTNEMTPFGVVENPLNKGHVAGGSSGGSAASVAEKSSYFSMGTDTGGSIRLPANFCNLVGFKPTYGRVSRYGQIAYASSLDQASPVANSVTDIGCIMEQITNKDDRDATNTTRPKMNVVDTLVKTYGDYLKGKKLGVCQEFIDGCTDEVKAELKKAIKKFEQAGVTTVDIELPHAKYAVSTYYIIATSEASSNLSRYDGIHYGFRKAHEGNLEDTYVETRSQGFGKEVKRRILLGTFSLSSGYYDAYYKKACQVRRLIYNDFKSALDQCDYIFSPVCATTAFRKVEASQDPLQMYMNDLYTIPVNLAGLPSLALPHGKDSKGLPTGFQLIGPQFSDENLLMFGKAWEDEGSVR